MSPLRLFTPNLQTQIRFSNAAPSALSNKCLLSSLDREELVPEQYSINQAEVAAQIYLGRNSPGDRLADAESKSCGTL